MKQYNRLTYNDLEKGCINYYGKEVKKRRIRINVL